MAQDIPAALFRLREAARTGPERYISVYIDCLQAVSTFQADSISRGLIRCRDVTDVESAIKVGLLYNDVSLLDMRSISNQMKLHRLAPNFFEKIGSDKI